jgi:predicted nucleic acid-binding protein
MPVTHLLDTSALLAHYFDEAGAAEVDAIWQEPSHNPAICVLTITELRGRLAIEVGSADEIERVLDLYVNQLTSEAPVDRWVAEEAARLREASGGRLPLVDACIAACASRHGCVLVHRDPHFDRLPEESVARLRLPDRS